MGQFKLRHHLRHDSADVKQILAWEAQDKSVPSTMVGATPGVATAATPVTTATTTDAEKTTDAPVTIGRTLGFGERLAALVSDDASKAGGAKQAMLTDVAAAIGKAVGDGGDFATMAQDAGQSMAANPSAPRRALAYLGGLLASVAGGSPSSLFADVNGTFDGAVSNAGTARAAVAGFKEGNASIDASIAKLGDIIGQSPLAGTSDLATTSATAAATTIAASAHEHEIAA